MTINSYERAILTVLLKKRIWLNTTEISTATGFSWNTVRKYALGMHKKKWIMKKGNYWKAVR